MTNKEKPLSPKLQFILDQFKAIRGVGEYVTLLIDVCRATIVRPPHLKLVLKQLYNIGVASLL